MLGISCSICAKLRRVLLKSLFPIVLLTLAMAVGWMLYPAERDAWARVDELHATWDMQADLMRISLVVEKRQSCTRMVVEKMLNRLRGGQVLINPVPVNGSLREKIQRIPANKQVTLWDEARPRAPVGTGLHKLSVRLICFDEKVPSAEQSTRAIETDIYVLHPNVRSGKKNTKRRHAGG